MEICTVGGFEEVGKNMTAVKYKEDVIIFDAGIHLPAMIELQGSDAVQVHSEKDLRNAKAIPNDLVLDKLGWSDKVRAIIISHAHLDHVAAVQYISYRYPNAIIYGSPFTIRVLESLMKDDKIRIRNKIQVVQPDSTIYIKGKEGLKVDMIHTTHSTIHCTFPALHTPEGIFFYALDLKFDNHPTLGNPPNYKKIKEIGKKGVKVLIVDALYSGTEKKPGGEAVADQLLKEAFSKVRDKNSALFVTTFSSHIERLNNIIKHAKKTGRQIIILGRSMDKYIRAAQDAGLCPFAKSVRVSKFRNQVSSTLKKVEKERGKYIIICTGHQAEENSILDRITKGDTPFRFRPGDNLIFSSSVIPTYPNVLMREKMDAKLRKMGVKIQTNVHVHGHGSREDLRDIIEYLNPEHIIPAHGSLEQETPMIDLAKEYGYVFGKTSHLTTNGNVLKF